MLFSTVLVACTEKIPKVPSSLDIDSFVRGKSHSDYSTDLGLRSIFNGATGNLACNHPAARSFARIEFHPVKGSADSSIFCTGAMINANTILTAAHCGGTATFSGNGEFSVSCGCDLETEKTTHYRKIVDTANRAYVLDAAVLSFSKLPPSCQAVQLAETQEVITVGDRILIAGFGAQSDTPAGSFALGTATVSRMGTQEAPYHPLGLRRDMVVLRRADALEAGTCQGDSGAPYLFQTSDSYVQVGVHAAVSSPSAALCPVSAEMIGHQMNLIMKWLDAEGISYLRFAKKKDSLPHSMIDRGSSSGLEDPDKASEQCLLKTLDSKGHSESLWHLSSANGSEASCEVTCGVSAMAQLNVAPEVICLFGSKVLFRLGEQGNTNLSLCQRSSNPTKLLRLRFSSAQEPCAVQPQQGICTAQNVFPVFSGSSNHIACGAETLEPGWQTNCVTLKEDEHGTFSWDLFPEASDAASCKQYCQKSFDHAAASVKSKTCIFKSEIVN